MGNELAKLNTNFIQSVDDLGRIGTMMAKSGYFTDARDAAQASVKVMAGMEMGFGAFASMTGIFIIQGKPAVGANLMAGAVKANPKYDYRVKKMADDEVIIEFFEITDGKRESIGTSSFTVADARKAMVKNLDKFPRNMLFARAMSNGIRWFCPDVFKGNTAYVPEELGADMEEENMVAVEQPEEELKQNITEATPEPVIEGEIIEPINNTPAEEKPVEAPQKPKFDEKDFLRKYRHKAGLPAVTLADALKIQNSTGKAYGDMTVRELYGMSIGIQKKIDTMEYEQDKAPYLRKLGAINAILTAKASELEQAEMPKDPFVKGN